MERRVDAMAKESAYAVNLDVMGNACEVTLSLSLHNHGGGVGYASERLIHDANNQSEYHVLEPWLVYV